MKIKSQGILYAFMFIYSIVLFIIIPIFILFYEIRDIEYNLSSIILLIICSTLTLGIISILVYYFFILFKVYNYALELTHYKIIYKFINKEEILYKEIQEIYWQTLKTRYGQTHNIIKIIFRNKSRIILSIDKLSENQKKYITKTIQQRSRKRFNYSKWKLFY